MTKNNPTKITAEPGKQEIIITRELMHRGSSCLKLYQYGALCTMDWATWTYNTLEKIEFRFK